ncbi:hypothetical protein [Streptacidiphilus sp. P02-A3a]|uniref:hypothetical protein n=1 Tax=Streptacidiphilus sp. P02-A3a TaxID=2704468 RepID=UPI0015F8F010|nr:hypothetical protein [Streptacidiphilus sp. P02-A3a]QMU72143.1 hypothetical protein GXP74_31790 [Streptacidiphilus sp. P02-A3a]
MAAPLADVDALATRLGWSLAGPDADVAEAALADASALVRAVAGMPWLDATTAPDIAVSVVLAAAERRVRNPEGYRMEMQGSYQYQLPASAPSGIGLTSDETRMIRAAAGIGGLFQVPVASLGGSL